MSDLNVFSPNPTGLAPIEDRAWNDAKTDTVNGTGGSWGLDTLCRRRGYSPADAETYKATYLKVLARLQGEE